MEGPADSSEGVDHHESDGENGTAVGGDEKSREHLTNTPGYVSPHRVSNHCGQVEDEEEYVCGQGVGHQKVTRLLAQGTGAENAYEQNRIGEQGGQSDDSGRNAKQL